MDTDRQHAKESFQAMSFMEKVVYLIQNYWVTTLVVIVVGAIVISLIGQMTWNRPPEKVLGLGVHARAIDMDLVAEMEDKITEEFPSFTKDGRAFYVYWFYNGYTRDQVEQIQTTNAKLSGAAASGQLDLLFGDLETLEGDAKNLYLMGLKEVFTEEELQAMEEAAGRSEEDPLIIPLSYDISGDTGRTVERVRDEAYLLNLSGYNQTIDEVLIYQDTYMAIVAGAENTEEIRSFVFSLLGMTDYVAEEYR